MSDELSLEAVRERVDDVRVAMVATLERNGTVTSRPLTVQRIDEDGTVWFLVARDADWLDDGQQVDVALVDEGRTWVSVAGTADYDASDTAVEDLWDKASAQFFDDRSRATAMRVRARTWSYWAAPNRIAQVFQFAKAFVTDDTADSGTSGTIAT